LAEDERDDVVFAADLGVDFGKGVVGAFSVVSGFFLKLVDIRPKTPAIRFFGFASFFPEGDFSARSGFCVAMGHLIQCSAGSRKTLVKSFDGSQKPKTGPSDIMTRLWCANLQAR
jgi:hypothetical protein